MQRRYRSPHGETKCFLAALAALVAVQEAHADIKLAAQNPIAGAFRHSLDMVDAETRLSFAVALDNGQGQQVATTISAIVNTELLRTCDNGFPRDCGFEAWSGLEPNQPETGNVRVSFQPAVRTFAIAVENCGSMGQVGATATGPMGSAELPLTACVNGQWLVASDAGAAGGMISEVILRGSRAIFDEMYASMGTGQTGPDLMCRASDVTGRSETPIDLPFQVDNAGASSASDVGLSLLLPEGFAGRTRPAAAGRVVSFPLGTLAGPSSETRLLNVTPPRMDCHSRYVTIAVARGSAVESDAQNNVAVSTLTQDPRERLPTEDCSAGSAGDEDCDGMYDCADSDCRSDPACAHFFTPAVLWSNGDVPWDVWPPSLPPFGPENPDGPRPPALPDPYDLPPPRPQCNIPIHGMPVPAPAYCCEPPPPPGTQAESDYRDHCRPSDPNAIESLPATNANGIGFVAAGTRIEYIIHYENVGATDAHDVEILNVLPPELDESTLEIKNGGKFDPKTRLLRWVDPQVWPKDPREVRYTVNLRDETPVGGRARNVATIVFPDAFPPTRIDTNTLQHIVPNPGVDLGAHLFVARCAPGGSPHVWKVGVQNRGLANAYDVRATVVEAPSGVEVIDGEARVGTVVPLYTTDSEETVEIRTADEKDPCPSITWNIDYASYDGTKKSTRISALGLDGGDGVGCSCEIGRGTGTGRASAWLLMALAMIVVARRGRGRSSPAQRH